MAFVDPSLAKHRNRSRWRSLFSLGLGFIALAVVAELVYIFGLGNLREVIPDRIYRAGQPSSSKIKKYVANLGIKTIFNLKGCCDPTPWYVDEAGAAQDAGISLEEFSFSAGRLPRLQRSSDLSRRLRGPKNRFWFTVTRESTEPGWW